MRRHAVTAFLGCAALAAGCGSSSHATKGTTSVSPSPTATQPTSTRAQTQSPGVAPTTTATLSSVPQPTTTAQPTTSSTAVTSPAVQQSLCPTEQEPGILANFGHRHSVAAANRLIAHARHFGFQNLVVQRRSCADFAIVLTGIENLRQGADLQREARKVGLRVALECRSQPFQGGLAAVFGERRTRRGAMRIAARATHNGFQGLEVVEVGCHKWQVLLYGLDTPDQRRGLAKEARSVGFHVTFEPG